MSRPTSQRSRVARRLLAVLAVIVAATGSGCATRGIPETELSDLPIALTYWDPEETRRKAEQEQAQNAPQQTRAGVAQVDDLAGLIGAGAGQSQERIPGRLSLLHPRTGEIETITAAPPGARAMAWSSDHRYLIFGAAHATRNVQLYEWDRETGDVRPLTRSEDDTLAASYGPGRRYVFAALDRAGKNPRLMSTDGPSGLPHVLREEVLADAVAWSPEGEAIVYARPILGGGRGRGLRYELRIVDDEQADTAEDRRLAPGREPVFTPDGRWIVYSAPVRGSWQLRRVRPDGTGRAPLGGSQHEERRPAVSPDGKAVVYVAAGPDGGRLHVRRFDGTGDRLLLLDGSVEQPVW